MTDEVATSCGSVLRDICDEISTKVGYMGVVGAEVGERTIAGAGS